MDSFVSGTSANGLHFQVYLIEGHVRWNRDRAIAATQAGASNTACSNMALLAETNRLHRDIYGMDRLHLVFYVFLVVSVNDGQHEV